MEKVSPSLKGFLPMPKAHKTPPARVHNAAPRTVTRRNVPLLVRYDQAAGVVVYHVPDGAFTLPVPNPKVAAILVAALRSFLHARIGKRKHADKLRSQLAKKAKLLRQLDRTIAREARPVDKRS